jgi:hypothetical protein
MAGGDKLWDTAFTLGLFSHAQNLHMFLTVENCFMQQYRYCEALKGTIAHHVCDNTKQNLSSVDRVL